MGILFTTCIFFQSHFTKNEEVSLYEQVCHFTWNKQAANLMCVQHPLGALTRLVFTDPCGKYTCFLQVNFRFSVVSKHWRCIRSSSLQQNQPRSRFNVVLFRRDSDDLRAPSGVRCFFEIKQGDANATLDQGDQLLAGEGLLLPTLLVFFFDICKRL